MVLKVENYGDEATGEDCYPGVIGGKVMGGLLDGRTVSIAVRKTLTNQRVTQVADLQNEDSLSHTLPGGYLAFEGVRSDGGKLTAQWLNRMGGPDAVVRSGMPIQIAPSYDRDGNVRRFKVNGATVFNAHIMHLPQCETAENKDSLRTALASALEDKGAALVALAPGAGADSESWARQTHLAIPSWRDGARIPAADAADEFLARHGEPSLQPRFNAGAKADVIPLEIVRLSSRVCESIDSGGKHAVPITRYQTGGIGVRIEAALRRSGPEAAEKLENAFLSQAHPHARESFAAKGWKGVWGSDISRFFAAADIELPYIPKYGFAVSTAFFRHYVSGDNNLYLAKARPLTAALPRNAVPTPSDPDAHARHHAAVYEAVSRLAEFLPDSPSSERESRAARAKIEASMSEENHVQTDITPGDSASETAFEASGVRLPEPGNDELMNF